MKGQRLDPRQEMALIPLCRDSPGVGIQPSHTLTHKHASTRRHAHLHMHIPTRTDADLHTQIHTRRQAQILPHRATCMVITHRCTHSHTPANTETHTYMLTQKRMHMDTFQQT